jgi:hypothetical protein
MIYQDIVYENCDSCYNYDFISTEADSSDGSEECFAYLSIPVVKYKTEPCKNYSFLGYCSYGDKCQFAHGNF